MRLLLDTSYLLPAVGIGVHNIPRTAVRDLQARGHRISICTITMFELAAKGAKFVRNGKIEETRLRQGQALRGDESIVTVDFQEHEILTRAIALRTDIDDFIDCLILAAGVATCDGVISEDEEFHNLISRDEVRSNLRPINPQFEVYPFRKAP